MSAPLFSIIEPADISKEAPAFMCVSAPDVIVMLLEASKLKSLHLMEIVALASHSVKHGRHRRHWFVACISRAAFQAGICNLHYGYPLEMSE